VVWLFCCIDPVEVIGLYKGLLPSEFQSSLNNLHPTEPPPLEGEALTRATKCLIDFLNQVQYCYLSNVQNTLRVNMLIYCVSSMTMTRHTKISHIL